jgi:hypothetical protein
MSSRRVALFVALVLVIAYAWFATGAKPFQALSYVVVAIPILIMIGLYAFLDAFVEGGSRASQYYRERSLGVSLTRSTPWIAVLMGAVILEAVGLILGGRSSRVPTLSTMVDHLLSSHWLRCVLFLLWLTIGVTPLRRRIERRRLARPE